jgi:drug/metabolite transporter (DMT)-like permease
VLTIVVVLSNVIGNFSLSRGMRGTPAATFDSALGYIGVLFNPWVAAGVLMLVVYMLSQMLLLSWADLSYVLPVTSIGYALTAVAGRVFLDEQISPARWAGVLLIMLGVAVVGRTAHSTTGLGAK